MAKMPVLTLKAILASQKADALAAMSAAQLSQDRADAQDYYLGDMSKDMPAQEGKSRAVSTDVADTIEGLMPSLMDIFAGSDEVVRFEPVGPEDEEPAQQETDYVNHVFMQQNPGFMVLYAFIKDALLSKVGIVKVFWDEHEEEQRETYLDQPDEAFALLAQAVMQPESGLEIVEHTKNDKDGVITHDVTVKTTKTIARASVMGVPPEEFGIERGARDIKTCNYCFHEVVTKTEAQLIAEGFDEEQVKALSDYKGTQDTETQSRDIGASNDSGGQSSTNTATRLVKITEHYIRLDYEGKGRPCLYMITTGGDQGEILKRDGKECIEPCDVIPFACTTPVPITHRFFGRSIADLVMDIQRIKTALLRGMLDNLYLHNNPRVEVAEANAGVNTLDDLLVSRAGGVVRTKTAGGLNWQVVPDITGSVYPALQYMDSTREMRTGITRQSQGVDADALQNQSATAVNQAFSASQARMKLIARIIAEGVRDMFSLLHGTVRKHGQQEQTVRLRNNWVKVDPRQWKTRNDMTINVGLGTGGKAERVAHLMALMNVQEKLILGGKAHLVDDTNIYNSFKELAKLMDYKNPDQFVNDPAAKDPQTGEPLHPPQPPPPDPAMVKVQADMQMKDKELAMKGQEIQAKAQIDAQADERKAQIENVQAQADMVTQDRKMQGEMQLAQQKFELEKELKLMDFQLKREQHAAEMQFKREAHEQAIQAGAFKVAAGAEAHGQKMELNKAAAESKSNDQ